jgi:hypothetical protein
MSPQLALGRPSIEPEDRRLAGVELTRSLKCRTAALDPKRTTCGVAGFRTVYLQSE